MKKVLERMRKTGFGIEKYSNKKKEGRTWRKEGQDRESDRVK